MKPILLLIVNILLLIQISIAQLNCPNGSSLEEQSKIFYNFNSAVGIIECTTQINENIKTTKARTGCGLRNVGGLSTETATVSASASVSASVCITLIFQCDFCVFKHLTRTVISFCHNRLIQMKLNSVNFHSL